MKHCLLLSVNNAKLVFPTPIVAHLIPATFIILVRFIVFILVSKLSDLHKPNKQAYKAIAWHIL